MTLRKRMNFRLRPIVQAVCANETWAPKGKIRLRKGCATVFLALGARLRNLRTGLCGPVISSMRRMGIFGHLPTMYPRALRKNDDEPVRELEAP